MFELIQSIIIDLFAITVGYLVIGFVVNAPWDYPFRILAAVLKLLTFPFSYFRRDPILMFDVREGDVIARGGGDYPTMYTVKRVLGQSVILTRRNNVTRKDELVEVKRSHMPRSRWRYKSYVRRMEQKEQADLQAVLDAHAAMEADIAARGMEGVIANMDGLVESFDQYAEAPTDYPGRTARRA